MTPRNEVAPAGGRAVAGSNPVSPINGKPEFSGSLGANQRPQTRGPGGRWFNFRQWLRDWGPIWGPMFPLSTRGERRAREPMRARTSRWAARRKPRPRAPARPEASAEITAWAAKTAKHSFYLIRAQ